MSLSDKVLQLTLAIQCTLESINLDGSIRCASQWLVLKNAKPGVGWRQVFYYGLVHTYFVVIGYPVHQVSVNQHFPIDFLKLNEVLMHQNRWHQSIFSGTLTGLDKIHFFMWNGRYNILCTKKLIRYWTHGAYYSRKNILVSCSSMNQPFYRTYQGRI